METTTVKNSDLTAGQTILGDSGGTVLITGEVSHSNVVFGCMYIETEVGSLYLDADGFSTIVE